MFTIKSELVLGLLAAFIVGLTLYFAHAAPARTVEGNNALPTSSSFHLISEAEEAKRTLTIKTTKPLPANSVFSADFVGNVLSERPAQTRAREELGVSAEVTIRRDLFDPATNFPFSDWGTFAAFNPEGHKYDDSLVVGLRASPFRFPYDVVAYDFLVSPSDVGLGLSFYAPPDLMGDRFAHWGLGYGRLWSFRYGGQANVFYLAFSTKDL